MTRRATTTVKPDTEPASGGFGSVLRGSVNSVVGAAGLNLPLRAVERLTNAVENASAILERLERATTRLDEIDDDFLDRAYDTLDVLAAMREDTEAMRARMESMEREVRELRILIGERFDQVPLLRRRKGRQAEVDEPPQPAPPLRSRGRSGAR